jgi:hypothetical protein
VPGHAGKLYFDESDVRIPGIGWEGEVIAATKIQRAFRDYRERKAANRFENGDELMSFTRTFTGAYAFGLTTSSVNLELRRMNVVTVQQFVLAKLAQRAMEGRKPKSGAAAIKIQRWWRRSESKRLRQRKFRHPHLQEDDNCTFVLQSSRDSVAAMRHRKACAVRLSTFFLRLFKQWKLRDRASRMIARAFRLFRVQRTYCMRKRDRRLEQLKQMEIEREQQLLETAVGRNNAALTIYYHWLRYKAQKVVNAIEAHRQPAVAGNSGVSNKFQKEAATIQRFWRASVARMEATAKAKSRADAKTRKLLRERVAANAVAIQTSFRSFLAKRELESRREQMRQNRELAAVKIQKAVRRWLASNEAWQLRISQMSMFKELQRLRRAAAARNKAMLQSSYE